MAAKKKATNRGPARPRRKSTVDGDTHKVEQSAASASARPSKSKEGRRARRRKKGSVGGFRDILTVRPKEESFNELYTTRWVKDSDEKGHKLLSFYNNDWDFVRADEVEVGENFVYKTRGAESIVRVPAGTGKDVEYYMFLLKKYKDWYDEDQMEIMRKVDEEEAYIDRKKLPSEKTVTTDTGEELDGFYGEGETEWESKATLIIDR
jgi:hypothetical protein